MQGCEHQMACFSRGNGCCNSFRVSHLSYHDNIGILPKCGSQGAFKAYRVLAYLPLVNYSFVIFKNVFKWVFNSNDVVASCVVPLVNQSSERGALPVA